MGGRKTERSSFKNAHREHMVRPTQWASMGNPGHVYKIEQQKLSQMSKVSYPTASPQSNIPPETLRCKHIDDKKVHYHSHKACIGPSATRHCIRQHTNRTAWGYRRALRACTHRLALFKKSNSFCSSDM